MANHNSPRLVLASTSPYRRALLERLGIPFIAVAPACDEESLKNPQLAPQAMAELLAEAKAASLLPSLLSSQSDSVIIGSDQICAVDEIILHKPGTAERAVEQLERLQGRAHRLITAMTVIQGTQRWHYTDITTLVMRPQSRAALQRYVAADEPFDCAGAYKLELRGISLFERIDSADQSAIVGLPLIALAGRLRELGFSLP